MRKEVTDVLYRVGAVNCRMYLVIENNTLHHLHQFACIVYLVKIRLIDVRVIEVLLYFVEFKFYY